MHYGGGWATTFDAVLVQVAFKPPQAEMERGLDDVQRTVHSTYMSASPQMTCVEDVDADVLDRYSSLPAAEQMTSDRLMVCVSRAARPHLVLGP